MMKNMPASALDNPFAQQQKILLYVLPLVFAVSGVNFPIGVLIYWLDHEPVVDGPAVLRDPADAGARLARGEGAAGAAGAARQGAAGDRGTASGGSPRSRLERECRTGRPVVSGSSRSGSSRAASASGLSTAAARWRRQRPGGREQARRRAGARRRCRGFQAIGWA